jgi:hypothetical protein
VGVKDVRWEGEGYEIADIYSFFMEKGNDNHQLGTGFIVHNRTVSAFKGVEFVSGRM